MAVALRINKENTNQTFGLKQMPSGQQNEYFGNNEHLYGGGIQLPMLIDTQNSENSKGQALRSNTSAFGMANNLEELKARLETESLQHGTIEDGSKSREGTSSYYNGEGVDYLIQSHP